MRYNIWGGPCCAKSTVAEGLSHNLKKKGHNVELVREVIKEWAYLKRVPISFDQVFLTSSQIYQEDILLTHGVEHIITDSPIMMAVAYAKRYKCEGWPELLSLAVKFEKKYPSFNILLSREGIPYKQNGRYEDRLQAVEMDNMMEEFMNANNVSFVKIPSVDLEEIVSTVESKLAEPVVHEDHIFCPYCNEPVPPFGWHERGDCQKEEEKQFSTSSMSR